MAGFLNRTGRPILYSCSWPAYVVSSKQTVSIVKPAIAAMHGLLSLV